MKIRLQLVLAAVLTLIAIVPVMLFGVVVFHLSSERALEAATERYMLIANSMKKSLWRFATHAESDFEHVLSLSGVLDESEAHHWKTAGFGFSRFCIIGRDNIVLHPADGDLADACQFREETILELRSIASTQKVDYSPVMKVAGQQPAILFYRGLSDGSLAIGELQLEFIFELQQSIAFGQFGHAAIIDQVGQVIAHPSDAWRQGMKDLADIDPVARMLRNETGVSTFHSPFLDEEVVVGFTTVPEVGWGIMVGQPLAEVYASAATTRTLAVTMTLVGLAVAVTLSWMMSRYLVQPVEAVASAAKRLAGGDLRARVAIESGFQPKEFLDLGANFNVMADQISAHQRTREQQAKRESDEQLGRITANIPGLVFRRVQTPAGDVSFPYFHTGRDNVFGVSFQKGFVSLVSLCSILHPDDSPRWQEAVENSAKTLHPFDKEFRICSDATGCKWARAIVYPLREPDGTIVWEGIALDISAQKAYEQELIKSKDEAERINQSKSRFLAAASHDLRQPLQVMSWLIGILKSKVATASDQQVVSDLASAQAVMANLLNALLNISQLESGAIDPEVADCPVRMLFDQISSSHQRASGIAGMPLKTPAPAIKVIDSSAVFRSDPVLLRSILDNFVANALHHAKATRIVVGCRRRGDKISLQVWDDGIGIEAFEQKVIFEEFYQVTNPSRDRSRGLGLGLAIVRRTADLLGHEIEVRSVPGKGSMFSVTVPRGEVQWHKRSLHEPEQGESQALRGRSVLLIDDDQMVLDASRALLTRWGAKVSSARDGEEALKAVGNGSPPPDVIIGDHRLPGDTTGIELVELLRKRCGRKVPAVIVTGDTGINRLSAYKHDDLQILYKPVQPARLLSLVNHMIQAENRK